MSRIFLPTAVIGAESERCSSFANAMRSGEPIYTKADSTLADGLVGPIRVATASAMDSFSILICPQQKAVPKVGINALATARPLVDKVVVVKEEFIAMAILRSVSFSPNVCRVAG